MATNKKALFGALAVKAWDVAGEKSLNAALALSTEKFSKNMQENYNVKSEQITGLTEWISEFSAYIITQAIHKQKIDGTKISGMIYSNLVPKVSSIASNNPKGEEIITKISDMTDEEDEQFVNDVFNSVKMDFSSPQAAKDSFDKFVKVAGEVAKFSELQETKRTQIRADAEVAIKKVEAMRDILKQYLNKSFDERSAIFMKQFEVVDQALAKGDNTMLSAGLTAINELAASNPFKALADINSVQQMLTDDSEFDL